MHSRFRKGTALAALVTLTTSACSDLVTSPGTHSAPAPAAPSLTRVTAPATGAPAYGCRMTFADPVGPRAYRQSHIDLRFPAIAVSPTGETRRFTHRSYSDGSRLNRILVCEIPATPEAASIASVRLGIPMSAMAAGKTAGRPARVGILNDTDTPVLDPITVTACQYGGEYPGCNPAPIDHSDYLNDCSLYGVCAGGGSWYWGPGEGGGGSDGGTFVDGGPFIGALACLLGFAATGVSMLDVASAFADVIRTGRSAGGAERTYVMYNQQPVIDPTMHIHLESEMNSAKQAYRDALGDLTAAMRVSGLTAGGSILGCAAAFALPTP